MSGHGLMNLYGTPALLMGLEPTHRDEYLGISRDLLVAESTITESSCENCGRTFQLQDSIVQRRDGAIVQCQHWNGFQGEDNA